MLKSGNSKSCEFGLDDENCDSSAHAKCDEEKDPTNNMVSETNEKNEDCASLEGPGAVLEEEMEQDHPLNQIGCGVKQELSGDCDRRNSNLLSLNMPMSANLHGNFGWQHSMGQEPEGAEKEPGNPRDWFQD